MENIIELSKTPVLEKPTESTSSILAAEAWKLFENNKTEAIIGVAAVGLATATGLGGRMLANAFENGTKNLARWSNIGEDRALQNLAKWTASGESRLFPNPMDLHRVPELRKVGPDGILQIKDARGGPHFIVNVEDNVKWPTISLDRPSDESVAASNRQMLEFLMSRGVKVRDYGHFGSLQNKAIGPSHLGGVIEAPDRLEALKEFREGFDRLGSQSSSSAEKNAIGSLRGSDGLSDHKPVEIVLNPLKK